MSKRRPFVSQTTVSRMIKKGWGWTRAAEDLDITVENLRSQVKKMKRGTTFINEFDRNERGGVNKATNYNGAKSVDEGSAVRVPPGRKMAKLN